MNEHTPDSTRQEPLSTENPASAGGWPSVWRRWRVPVLLTLLFATAAVWMTRGGGPVPESRIAWGHDWDAAVAEAGETGRPILVLATADWCPPCRDLKRGPLQRDAVVAAIAAGFIPVKADVTDDNAPGYGLAQRFDVKYLPTMLIVDAAGQRLLQTSGYVGDDDLLRFLADGRDRAFAQGGSVSTRR